MRLLTLNIRLGAGGGVLDKPAYDVPASDKRDAALAQAIQTVAPDIVALQEVRNRRHAEKIARHLTMNCLYTPHPSSYSLNFFEWGLALLHRFRLRRHGNFAVFFDPDVRTGRNGLWAELDGRGFFLTVMNVHLDARRAPDQIKTLAARAAGVEGPLVIMGDFNISPDDDALAPLKDTMTDTCRSVDTPGSREAEAAGTLTGDRCRLDQIWVTEGGFIVREAGLLPSRHRGVSDHIGFYADVVFDTATGSVAS
jgi:endonuclease/exonuclease/phosphatase family metal-dependent hydrolase